jgi:phage shock protein A
MDSASVDRTRAAEGLMDAVAQERAWWMQEGQRQKEQAELWRGRIDLAERHGEFDLATEAAQRARHHAGLALAADRHRADLEAGSRDPDRAFSSRLEGSPATTASAASFGKQFIRPEAEQSVDARLAAIKAARRLAVQREAP